MKAKLVVVGAFPKDKAKVFGGFVTVCNALNKSSFPEKFDLVLIDTTPLSLVVDTTAWSLQRISLVLVRKFVYLNADMYSVAVLIPKNYGRVIKFQQRLMS